MSGCLSSAIHSRYTATAARTCGNATSAGDSDHVTCSFARHFAILHHSLTSGSSDGGRSARVMHSETISVWLAAHVSASCSTTKENN